MPIKIDANCLVSTINNIMSLDILYHYFYLEYADITYVFRHKQDNILFKFDGNQALFSQFESQMTNIKFHRNDDELIVEFLDSYQNCLKQLVMIFDSVRNSCSYDVNILDNGIDIDNITKYIKFLECDVDYDDVVSDISDLFAIPESIRHVNMYCDIVFLTCMPGEDTYFNEYLEINCSSSSMIVNGICNSEQCRLIIKHLCLDLQNFEKMKNDGTLDSMLSTPAFYFSNDYNNCVMLDINILQRYMIILRNYYPTLKLTTLNVGCNIDQTISINHNLVGKSAANSAQ